jgi:putative membrane protein
MLTLTKSPKNNLIINVISIAIPLAVAGLLSLPTKLPLGDWTKVLPHYIGIINSTTAITLIIGLIAIKQKNIAGHRKAMGAAVLQGAVFLVLYILYHVANESTKFGGEGLIKGIYFFLLASHIILSIGVVRLVLMALYHALTGDIEAHKKTVKWAYPIWLYVSVTGVIVYLMISPYYV